VTSPRKTYRASDGHRKHVLGGCTQAQPGGYHWTVHARRWCGLSSNYFEHLLHFVTHTKWIRISPFLRDKNAKIYCFPYSKPKTLPNGAWILYVLSRQIYNYENCAANYSHPLHNKDHSPWVVCIYKLIIINYHIPVTIKAVAKNFARRRETNCETHRHMKFWI